MIGGKSCQGSDWAEREPKARKAAVPSFRAVAACPCRIVFHLKLESSEWQHPSSSGRPPRTCAPESGSRDEICPLHNAAIGRTELHMRKTCSTGHLTWHVWTEVVGIHTDWLRDIRPGISGQAEWIFRILCKECPRRLRRQWVSNRAPSLVCGPPQWVSLGLASGSRPLTPNSCNKPSEQSIGSEP